MRKGTKKIRKVKMGENEYYVYDLNEDVFGKRKRLYAKSEQELELKIRQAELEKKAEIHSYKPKEKLFADYANYYFKNAVGQIHSKKLKRLITIFEKSVLPNFENRNIDEIGKDEMQDFYNGFAEKFPLTTMNEVDEAMRSIYALAAKDFEIGFDFSEIKIPTSKVSRSQKAYIPTPEEFEEMLTVCIEDNGKRYKKNEQVIIFCMLTGHMFSEIKKLTAADIDLEGGTARFEGGTAQLSERAVKWLDEQDKAGLINLNRKKSTKKNKDKSITRYTDVQLQPVFLNGNGMSPSLQSIQTTLSFISNWCGLPKGITCKSLVKGYVLSELEKGTPEEEILKHSGIKYVKTIWEIRDEAEVRKMLF